MIRLGRLSAIARKETLHIVRDWRSLFLAIAIPLILILLFGYALDMDLDDVPLVVWDQSRTPRSRELLSLFDGSPYFTIVAHHDGYRGLEEALRLGTATVALVIPSDFAEDVLAGKPASVQVIADGSDANTARLALNYATALGLIYDERILVERLAAYPVGTAVEIRPRAWYNVDLHSPNVIIPGILAVVMVVIAAMLTSVTVAREWEMGTMEQLISTPVRKTELILGKVAPYFALGLLDVAVSVLLGRWLFGVPLRGSPALLVAMASVFLTGALFLGLLLSIVLRTQVLANQTAILASYLPTLMLSGFLFAIENMPPAIRCITYVVPARYFIALLRGIFLKGIGLEVLWLNALLLTAYAAIMVLLAHRKLRLKLE